MSQNDLSTFLNVDRSLISKYEKGEREVPLSVLEKLANLFGVDLAAFLESEPEENVLNQALAFRKDKLHPDDLKHLASFKKIVMNYIDIREWSENE